MKQPITRRRVLRGVLNGVAVTVALPLLDCFLNDNGTALANGAPLPVRFGTWSWGCGMDRRSFVPKKVGADYDLPPEIRSWQPVRRHINVLTNFNCFPDSAPTLPHYTGWVIQRSGSAPMTTSDRPGQTIDVTIARQIAVATRFPSLTVSATGDERDTVSYESANAINMAIDSPLELYQKLFGAGFQNPNAPGFKPDPVVLARESVLSSVMDDTRKMRSTVGAADKSRLDQYFTGLRDLEHQLALETVKPVPRAACVLPSISPFEQPILGVSTEAVAARHKLMTDLLVMAFACDQARVFNMMYSKPFAGETRGGYDKTHHTATHEEPIDETLGCQPHVSWFVHRSMENWAAFVEAFSKMKEGDGTLLDNTLIFASTDVSFAKLHTIVDMPVFTAGRAGGKLRTGLHVDGAGSPSTRIGYTVLRAMGVGVRSWGTQSNRTSKEVSEILA